MTQSIPSFLIRRATAADVPVVIALDEETTGMAKPDYWRDMFERYGNRPNRFFLVADSGGTVLGFIIGEVRAWEFGSPPCGWIFAVDVKSDTRQGGIGTALFHDVCQRFRESGVGKVRTMLARDDVLLMSFFRSQGMMAGPFIELEMDLDE